MAVQVIADAVSAVITQPAYASGISPVNGQVQEEESLGGQHVDSDKKPKKKQTQRRERSVMVIYRRQKSIVRLFIRRA
jgi:hypothetical protein